MNVQYVFTFVQRFYTLKDKHSPLQQLESAKNHLSVCMNTFILQSMRAKAIKFGDNMSYYCKHINVA